MVHLICCFVFVGNQDTSLFENSAWKWCRMVWEAVERQWQGHSSSGGATAQQRGDGQCWQHNGNGGGDALVGMRCSMFLGPTRFDSVLWIQKCSATASVTMAWIHFLTVFFNVRFHGPSYMSCRPLFGPDSNCADSNFVIRTLNKRRLRHTLCVSPSRRFLIEVIHWWTTKIRTCIWVALGSQFSNSRCRQFSIP